jgi:poly-gamma-glutamate synthesis protein (capsule biosynthesis protein)
MKKLILVLFLIVLSACTVAEVTDVVQVQPNTVSEVSFVAVGDNLIHDAIYEAAYTDNQYDFKPFYQALKPLIKQHDLAFINQETMLGGVELGLSSYPSFNSPVEVGDAIIDAGFNLISIANNHTLDRGERAIVKTIDYFAGKDVYFSGAKKQAESEDVVVFEINNIKFAFVAYTMWTNGQKHPEGKTYLANVYSRGKAKLDIEKYRDQVDFFLVSMHWGTEYQDEPSLAQMNEAQYLAQLEVDVIIGHHPHVVQPIKIIENDEHNTYVAYSLGNFMSAQVGVDRKIGMTFHMKFNKTTDLNNQTVRKGIDGLESKLLYHYKDKQIYQVQLFKNINDLILPDYQKYYDQKVSLIKSYYEDMIVE